jgi:hypothetical protein
MAMSKYRKMLLGFLFAAFAVSALGFVLLLALAEVDPALLLQELAKGLLQIALIAVFGSVVSLLTYEYQQSRAQTELKLRLKESTLARIAASYREVKSARRLLRGRALLCDADGNPDAILLEPYEQQFETINNAQLDLEDLADEVRTNIAAFSSPIELASEIDRMERYLGRLISEYEGARRLSGGEPPTVEMKRLPWLDGFLARRGQDPEKFSHGFAGLRSSYQTIQGLIRNDLTGDGALVRKAQPSAM